MSNNRRNNQYGNCYNLNSVSSNGNQGYLRNDQKTQTKNNQNQKNYSILNFIKQEKSDNYKNYME